MSENLLEFLKNHEIIKKQKLPQKDLQQLVRSIEEDYLADLLAAVIQESENIMAIDPRLSRQKVLEIAAKKIVTALHAEGATIRLFDPVSLKMLAAGAYGFQDFERVYPLKDSIAGKVVQENRGIPVSCIRKDPLYKNKEVVLTKGFNSLLAVPISIPSFVGNSNDVLGSLQIYWQEDNRQFAPLEILLAEMMARRVSFVLAKKKIIDLHELNARKEKIVNKIFVKLSKREAIKLKDLFVLLIPELEEILLVQNCSLFSLSEDQQHISLEAAYPLDMAYYEVGHTFTVGHHPYFDAAVHGGKKTADTPFERIASSHILIKDPKKSKLISPGLKDFAEQNRIHSILLVPLKIGDLVRHVLTFYASESKQFFTDEEIELLTFFGKEIMKAAKLEFLADVLHDLKNPAVAVAGLAARARKLLDSDDLSAVRDKLKQYIDVVVRETARLQDMAISLSGEGKEREVDLCSVAVQRYQLNEEVVSELGLDYIEIKPPETEKGLIIKCPLFGLERVLDNLLNNATKAIPKKGGSLTMRCYRQESMACLHVTNSGAIPDAQIEQVKQGEVRGRGLNIIYRFVKSNHGKISVEVEDGHTSFIIKLPLAKATPKTS